MIYDVVVIGGGPSGMMSAIKAGESGAKVILLEKNDHLGVKLLCTGKGRCNITNNTSDLKEFIKQFGKNGKFLFSCLHNFNIKNTIDFFENGGLETQAERGNRIFPKNGNALDVLKILINYLKQSKVEVRTKFKIAKIIVDKDKITKVIGQDKQEIVGKNYIICTGGKSYPLTGSTGDGYKWANQMNHSIIEPLPALSPIIVKEKFVKNLEGLSLKNVNISIYKDNKKIDSRDGEAIFTANGMSGPIILDMSKKIKMELEEKNNLKLKIDFKPALDFDKLNKRIIRELAVDNKKMFKNILTSLLPQKMIPVIIELSKIDPNKQASVITKLERNRLVHLLKEFELTVTGLLGFKKAIITSGGIDLSEIDPTTMRSKKISNLFFAGEIINIDGPTGGYNLQVCWSTGQLAGKNAVKK